MTTSLGTPPAQLRTSTTMHGERNLDLAAIENLVIAGWTGRNVAALEAHIKELEALGVARPKSVPIFYRNSASLLTTSGSIEVVGDKSSGEVEFVLYSFHDGLWLGIGSDHTDRHAETINVTLSKQMCAKPVGPRLWSYAEVKPHWEKLTLRSFLPSEGGKRRLYQEGSVATMRSPEELIKLYTDGDTLAAGTAMFCGTLPAHGGVSSANVFEMELEDPVLDRRLTHCYSIVQLPDEG
ncbi:MAG: DUF2848 domain-containing protein [Xanthobacteraceae bacterium]